MSVPKTKRGTSKLKVITESRRLAAYTLKITQSEKNFPKRYRSFVKDEIVTVATDISKHIYKANSIRVTTEDDYARRRASQQEAIDLTYVLLNNIGIWHMVNRIEGNRIDYWSGLIMEVQRLLRSWKDADFQRYTDNKK